MQRIKAPSPRKQELLTKFFWLRTFLLSAARSGVKLNLSPAAEKAVIETVWNAQTAYTQADDDEYNFNIALETYQMIENGLMGAGIDMDAGIRLVMEKNGYKGFNQLKPTKPRREIPGDFFEIAEQAKAGIGNVDPWNM